MKSATTECNKCGGTGTLFNFSHVKAGVCFSCNGTGIKHKLTRTKVIAEYWQVKCEAESCTYDVKHSTFVDAEIFANQVSEMHLSPLTISKVKGFTYEFKKSVA